MNNSANRPEQDEATQLDTLIDIVRDIRQPADYTPVLFEEVIFKPLTALKKTLEKKLAEKKDCSDWEDDFYNACRTLSELIEPFNPTDALLVLNTLPVAKFKDSDLVRRDNLINSILDSNQPGEYSAQQFEIAFKQLTTLKHSLQVHQDDPDWEEDFYNACRKVSDLAAPHNTPLALQVLELLPLIELKYADLAKKATLVQDVLWQSQLADVKLKLSSPYDQNQIDAAMQHPDKVRARTQKGLLNWFIAATCNGISKTDLETAKARLADIFKQLPNNANQPAVDLNSLNRLLDQINKSRTSLAAQQLFASLRLIFENGTYAHLNTLDILTRLPANFDYLRTQFAMNLIQNIITEDDGNYSITSTEHTMLNNIVRYCHLIKACEQLPATYKSLLAEVLNVTKAAFNGETFLAFENRLTNIQNIQIELSALRTKATAFPNLAGYVSKFDALATMPLEDAKQVHALRDEMNLLLEQGPNLNAAVRALPKTYVKIRNDLQTFSSSNQQDYAGFMQISVEAKRLQDITKTLQTQKKEMLLLVNSLSKTEDALRKLRDDEKTQLDTKLVQRYSLRKDNVKQLRKELKTKTDEFFSQDFSNCNVALETQRFQLTCHSLINKHFDEPNANLIKIASWTQRFRAWFYMKIDSIFSPSPRVHAWAYGHLTLFRPEHKQGDACNKFVDRVFAAATPRVAL